MMSKTVALYLTLIAYLQTSTWRAEAFPTPQTPQQELGSPLRVAQCRAQCLQRFTTGPHRQLTCLQDPDCFMCWENCELLQSNFPVWGAMCSEKGICFPGCQQACRFHRETSQQDYQTQPVKQTRGEEVVKMSAHMARWPRPPTTSPSSPLVYVVMTRESSSTWRQLIQTVDLSVRLPAGIELSAANLRILVVDPEGLVTIYSPVTSTTSAMTGTEVLTNQIISKVMAGHRKKINTAVVPSTTRSTNELNGEDTWNLREVSLIHQKILVIAEVAWEPQVSRGVYLVTWEVDGGGLKGNLFTDSTCVTLSLWPDTIYHIQVELVSRTTEHTPERSDLMEIDTRRASKVSYEPSGTGFLSVPTVIDDNVPSASSHDVKFTYGNDTMSSSLLSVLVNSDVVGRPGIERSQQMELLAGSGAAILLFLVVVGMLIWKCRKHNSEEGSLMAGVASIKRKKLVEDYTSKKAMPPVLTLFADSAKLNPVGMCASADQATGKHFLANNLNQNQGDTAPLLSDDVTPPVTPSSTEGQYPAVAATFLKAAERAARNEVQV